MLSKTSNFVNFLSQKYILIFLALLLLLYFDSSFVDPSERFNLPEKKDYLIGIFLIFVTLFIFINMLLIFTIKNVFLKNYSILGTKIKVIHNIFVLYLITISVLIIILVSEMIILNSYNIYLIYSLLILTH